MKKNPLLMFFGDSITEGYMIEPGTSFPYVIKEKLKQMGSSIEVLNEGISGDRSADGLARIDAALKNIPDVFVLELGANDGLNGLSLIDLDENLQQIIDKVKKVNPYVRLVIAGMELPLNMDANYRTNFRGIFQRLSQNNNAILIPFILHGVATIPELNLEDGIHPTSEGHKIIAEMVWNYINPILEKTIV
jgi:acyl-CoA thioesterase I